MEFERQSDEFGGKRGAPPGKRERLMWSAGWVRGVRMLLEERGMLLRGANPGQGVPMGVEECQSSGAAIHAEHRRMGRKVKSVE